LNIGDKVRFKVLKGVFEKGYTRTYSKEVFTISRVEGNNYFLGNGQSYRINRLQKVANVDIIPDENPEPAKDKEVVERVSLNEEKTAQRRRRIKKAFDAHYDRDIKEITDEGEINVTIVLKLLISVEWLARILKKLCFQNGSPFNTTVCPVPIITY